MVRTVCGSDDDVCFEAIFEGTHTGVLHGGDTIATSRLYFDQIGLLVQLGVMPAPGG